MLKDKNISYKENSKLKNFVSISEYFFYKKVTKSSKLSLLSLFCFCCVNILNALVTSRLELEHTSEVGSGHWFRDHRYISRSQEIDRVRGKVNTYDSTIIHINVQIS